MRGALVLKRSMRTLRYPFPGRTLDEPLSSSSSPPRSAPVWTVLPMSTGGCLPSPAASRSPRSRLALVFGALIAGRIPSQVIIRTMAPGMALRGTR
jgi:hypothetical protein